MYVGQPFAGLRQSLSQNVSLIMGTCVASVSPGTPLPPRVGFAAAGPCCAEAWAAWMEGPSAKKLQCRPKPATNRLVNHPKVTSGPLHHLFAAPSNLGVAGGASSGAQGCTKRCEVLQWFVVPPFLWKCGFSQPCSSRGLPQPSWSLGAGCDPR